MIPLRSIQGRMLHRCALGLAAVLLLAAEPAGAAGPDESGVDVLVVLAPHGQSAESFNQVMSDATLYTLGRKGLASKSVVVTTEDSASCLSRAAASGAQIALLCLYSVEGRTMAVTLSWLDARAGAETARTEKAGTVNLQLDAVLLAALDEVLGAVADRVSALAAARAARNARAAALRAQAEAPPVVEKTPATRARFNFSLAYSSFLPVGEASSYLTLGYFPSLLAGVQFAFGNSVLSLDLCAGLDYFTAAGEVETSENYLMPFGLDARYAVGAHALRAFLHVGGGVAFLVMVTGSEGTLVDFLPYVQSGLGLEVLLGSWLGISASLDYHVYFEMPYLLMGFSPSIAMVVHL